MSETLAREPVTAGVTDDRAHDDPLVIAGRVSGSRFITGTGTGTGGAANLAVLERALVAFGGLATGVGVAMDGDVVPRGAWPDTPLRDGATVLTAVWGG
ncbi:ThiS family protein [Streptoalloteichus tenebrarius]|uniref:ThiS family protein n=1 Tax=Streptoalloteichus tenebrarius (strain ATCC 17920 / DSM 40477 / JCM 4838 / CBS 697.72 / NBRC 16177 / NCIMB 11028 / NRRL B-12390 / A12253. 1 / ISP 5477) TaxID=1933 RepID=A0ABT1HYJ4_STRSD|nr:ThiS family protein [Streptoalloteichus tenebrarius]BFF01477.1 hypothetical protein GCM10020241_31520 [Streptoalloteichus tenebrarius]